MAAGVQASTYAASNTLISGLKTDAKGNLYYDTNTLGQSSTWSQAGLSTLTSFATSSANIGLGSVDISNSLTKAVTSGLIGTLSHGVSVDSNGSFDWKGISGQDLMNGAGNMLGGYIGDKIDSGFSNSLGTSNPYLDALVNNVTTMTTRKLLVSVNSCPLRPMAH